MNHDDLYIKMKEDLYEVKDEIIGKLDGYQHRVTKLETEQGWIKRALIFILTTAIGLGSYYFKQSIALDNRKETHEKVIRHPRKTTN